MKLLVPVVPLLIGVGLGMLLSTPITTALRRFFRLVGDAVLPVVLRLFGLGTAGSRLPW